MTPEQIQRSPLFVETHQKLISVSAQLKELTVRNEQTKQKWAQARGDADHTSKSLEDHLAKHKKRWMELSSTGTDIQQAERITELEHKLKQALENVRQAEAVRMSFEEAMKLNESLQQKLDDMKAKNTALIANAKQMAAAKSDKTPTKGSSSSADSEMSVEKIEKMHREHRRMRKELAAAQQSKESARGKFDVSVVVFQTVF